MPKRARQHSLPGDLQMTNPDRVLYPQIGLTKFALAEYYAQIADWILPHVSERPLTLVRCPEGWEQECFYQKHAPAGLPEHVRRLPMEEKNETFLYVDDLAGLLSLVQFGVLEIHVWGAKVDRLDRPDQIVFDLDPDPAVGFNQVAGAARELRAYLTDLGLEGFLKTTGGKGLHVHVPIARRLGWKEVKEFSRQVAERLKAGNPQRYTTNPMKAARAGKIFIDYLRNSQGATFIAPYSTRARSGAPVAVPLDWHELKTVPAGSHFTVSNLPRRLTTLKTDPWGALPGNRQSIKAAMRAAVGMKAR